jgi:hypothetical protein
MHYKFDHCTYILKMKREDTQTDLWSKKLHVHKLMVLSRLLSHFGAGESLSMFLSLQCAAVLLWRCIATVQQYYLKWMMSLSLAGFVSPVTLSTWTINSARWQLYRPSPCGKSSRKTDTMCVGEGREGGGEEHSARCRGGLPRQKRVSLDKKVNWVCYCQPCDENYVFLLVVRWPANITRYGNFRLKVDQ